MLLAIRSAFSETVDKHWLEALADSQEEADAAYNEAMARQTASTETFGL
jgi:hypothetical protein